MVPNWLDFVGKKKVSETPDFYGKFYSVANTTEGPPFPSFLKIKTFVVGDVSKFGPFFQFLFLLFGDDGHFGDITKLTIEDTHTKKEGKKQGKKTTATNAT